jgi:hypothetical protein
VEAKEAGYRGGPPSDPPTLQHVEPFKGRQFMSFSELPYAALCGPDPVPHRPAVLHLEQPSRAINSKRWLVQKLAAVGLAPVRVMLLQDGSAFVQLLQTEQVPKAAAAIRKSGWRVQVASYREFFDSRRNSSSMGAEGGGGSSSGGGSGGVGGSGGGRSSRGRVPGAAQVPVGSSTSPGAGSGSGLLGLKAQIAAVRLEAQQLAERQERQQVVQQQQQQQQELEEQKLQQATVGANASSSSSSGSSDAGVDGEQAGSSPKSLRPAVVKAPAVAAAPPAPPALPAFMPSQLPPGLTGKPQLSRQQPARPAAAS